MSEQSILQIQENEHAVAPTNTKRRIVIYG